MYFPNAFRKMFISDGTVAAAGTSASLTAGKIGLFDYKTHTAIVDDSAANPVFYLAQGSFHTLDKLGKFHGGYKESVKSKGINPKYISKFHAIKAKNAQNQIIEVKPTTPLAFECGSTYYLRVDLKGSPALRFFGRNMYRTFDAYTGCCAGDCSAGCTGESVDPTSVLLLWADQINENEIFNDFIRAKVLDKAGAEVKSDTYVAETDAADIEVLEPKLVLEVAYVDTRFGKCSWDVTDHYEMEPLKIYPSLVDETGDPCTVKPQAVIAETQATQGAEGVGETVIRDYILSMRYAQEHFNEDHRLREVMNDIHLESGIEPTLSNKYDRYVIVHNVPRLNNSTSMFDNDQYALEIIVAAGTDMSAFTDLIESLLDKAGNGIEFEEF